MAEIRVERKGGAGKWVWLLILIVLIVAAIAYFWYAGYIRLGLAPETLQQYALLQASHHVT